MLTVHFYLHAANKTNNPFFIGESGNNTFRNKIRKCPIDMPMLMSLCEEMAKRGDKDFFRALNKLGILADVLANRSEYYISFAVTAREHGHSQLADFIVMHMSSRYIRTKIFICFLSFSITVT